MTENPWDVEYLEEYLVYSCPECRETSQNESEFLDHVLGDHPNSRPYLMKFIVKEDKMALDFHELKQKLQTAFEPDFKLENNSNEKQEYLDDQYENEYGEFTNDQDPLEANDDVEMVNDEKGVACKHCGINFHTSKYLQIHMKMCSKKKLTILKKSVATEEKVVEKEVGYKCTDCDETFESKYYYTKHNEEVHLKLNLKCEGCGKVFHGKAVYYNHIHHCKLTDNYKPTVCETCGKTLASKYSMKLHIELVHNKHTNKEFQCDKCEKQFITKGLLNCHIKRYHSGIIRPKDKSCPHCEYKTESSSILKTHIEAVHEGKKDYQCEHCPLKFARKPALTKHISAVHEKIKVVSCEHCGRGYSSKGALKDHIDAMHNNMRKWNCEFCGKTYAFKEGLRVHVQTVHQGIRFSCYRCNKSFTQMQNLKKHINESYHISYQEYLDAKDSELK